MKCLVGAASKPKKPLSWIQSSHGFFPHFRTTKWERLNHHSAWLFHQKFWTQKDDAKTFKFWVSRETLFPRDLTQKVKFSKETPKVAARKIFHFHEQTKRKNIKYIFMFSFSCGWARNLGFCGVPYEPEGRFLGGKRKLRGAWINRTFLVWD